jgi:hypothetical protein
MAGLCEGKASGPFGCRLFTPTSFDNICTLCYQAKTSGIRTIRYEGKHQMWGHLKQMHYV